MSLRTYLASTGTTQLPTSLSCIIFLSTTFTVPGENLWLMTAPTAS